jgi:hypothetical protein
LGVVPNGSSDPNTFGEPPANGDESGPNGSKSWKR